MQRFLLAAVAALVAVGQTFAQDAPSTFDKVVPESIDELRVIEQRVHKVVARVMPATVGLRIGQAQGSGVIVSKDGYVLTAAHVSGDADVPVEILLHDGRKLKGVTLGANVGIDSGMVKITEPSEFSFVPMAKSGDLKKGQWCVALGHPGGYQAGRTPVVRVGRVLDASARLVRTDCTLVGGDSGGPLFDLDGGVIGIHSRIGGTISYNIHVPVDTFQDTWERLAAAEVWGQPFPLNLFAKRAGYLGVKSNPEAKSCIVEAITPESPAAKAGLMVNDVILAADSTPIASMADLSRLLQGKRPGAEIRLEIRRGEEMRELTVTLGKRPD